MVFLHDEVEECGRADAIDTASDPTPRRPDSTRPFATRYAVSNAEHTPGVKA